MACYTVYYTVLFYPYKALIYKGFSAARFSVKSEKIRYKPHTADPTLKALSFLALFPLLAAEIVT